MIHSVHTPELESLLGNTRANMETSSPIRQTCVCSSTKYLCLPSRSAILLLFWTAIVGMMYFLFMAWSALFVARNPQPKAILSMYEPLPYAALVFVMMFYTLSRFIADVYCGHLKTVVVSLSFLLITILLLIGLSVVEAVPDPGYIFKNQSILKVILETLSLLAFVVGLAGYQANFFQLGLDQLFEAPSPYLGLFIHYASWAFNSGTLLILTLPVFLCIRHINAVVSLLINVMLLVIFILWLLFSYWKCSCSTVSLDMSILTEPFIISSSLSKTINTHLGEALSPSRMITFLQDWTLSRKDTEDLLQQNRLKTLNIFSILLVLFSVGPVFSIEMSASVFVFSLTNAHMLYYNDMINHNHCAIKGV